MTPFTRYALIAAILYLTFSTTVVSAQAPPRITKVAHLDDGIFGADETYRSVQLRIPWVYVLDRDGGLHTFKMRGNRLHEFASGLMGSLPIKLHAWANAGNDSSPSPLQFVNSIATIGDGNDLELIENALVLTSNGKLAVYSIDEPSDPKHIMNIGPNAKADSQSIVRAGSQVFALGKQTISAFNFSIPLKPEYTSTSNNARGNWNGCSDGKFLYVSERAVEPNGRMGIAVYNVTDPKTIVYKHFISTPRLAYHVFINSDDYLVACLDSKSRFHSVSSNNITVAGSTSIFETYDDAKPKLISTVDGCGGRSSVAITYKRKTILLCNGIAFSSQSAKLDARYKFFPDGHTLDGAPYGGDQYGQYAALATDNDIPVFRIGNSTSFRIGQQVGLLLKLLALP